MAETTLYPGQSKVLDKLKKLNCEGKSPYSFDTRIRKVGKPDGRKKKSQELNVNTFIRSRGPRKEDEVIELDSDTKALIGD
ncbi:hypothetical protein WICPIJ_000018 [Wickerhamomyces pijperi]|uniref:Uncharacterized protein n=1 Tax=Wickerhamomyces pijperi TaxID=599730 RepID=A0A9P8QI53_WICPI|nr:hypothetical protein WICPIJ_000018 [Wickerhamomyces pijperi]